MNKQTKKLLTPYTKRVLCELGVKYLTTSHRHPLLLDGVVKDYLRKHPGVTQKIFGFRDVPSLTATEIREFIIDWIMRVTRIEAE